MEHPLMLELLDLPTTFPLIWDIMGFNIQLYISQMIIKPSKPSHYKENKLGLGWHQDGGRPNSEVGYDHSLDEPSAGFYNDYQPMLTAKLSFWLSDTRIPDCGAMRIIPGSHRSENAHRRVPRNSTTDPEGAIELKVKAGTAVLFERRLWHSAANNYSDVTRKVLMFGYSYRWLRGLDYNTMPESLLRHCSPIRRQLLGDSADIKGHWQPTPKDVPLKAWLETHREGSGSVLGGSRKYAVDSPVMFPNASDNATYRNWPGEQTHEYRPVHTGQAHLQEHAGARAKL